MTDDLPDGVKALKAIYIRYITTTNTTDNDYSIACLECDQWTAVSTVRWHSTDLIWYGNVHSHCWPVGMTETLTHCSTMRFSVQCGLDHGAQLPCNKKVAVHIKIKIFTARLTRRRSESAYICQVNFFKAFINGWEGDFAPLKPSLYPKPFSK